ALLQQAFDSPEVDLHALAPELVLTGAIVVVLVADLFTPSGSRGIVPQLAGIGILAAFVPVLTLALDGADRVMFDGAYVVDDFALVMKALFLIAGYVVILLSTNYIAEGDYHEGEYYFLLLSSLLGMSVMASARDLISIFVALELLSIPAYMLAAWRKRDLKGNEAGLKYYLMGVFASAVLLYGMSLLYGVTGSTLLTEIGAQIGAKPSSVPFITLGILFIIVGFGFKVSAVPFHTWAPDTYEGAPTPIASFLAVASKAAGFVALLSLVFLAFPGRSDVVEPLMWILAAVTMTVGNLIALRQTNIVRLLAYSSVAQAGFMLAPLAVVGDAGQEALTAVVVYLLIYTAMNLGAFAVVIAVARRTGSGEIDSYRGLFQYSPALAVLMSVFLFALAGIPPLAGWVAKFVVFRALLSAETVSGAVLAVVVAVNSVIALFYYANVARLMWFQDAPEGETTSIRVPFSLSAALGIAVIGTLVFGIFPGLVTHFGDAANLAASAIP
ncbi:MAG: NADH-quinone oxidoreductase subunit N, partial [Acidimicrobiales bacterium]